MTKKFIACIATVLIAPVLGAAAVLAADTLTPPAVAVTLHAGQSTTIQKTLHLDGLPARADIIVAVDTTGSMGPAIAAAQADANNLCNTVQGSIPGARFAVMDFEDYFPGPGQAGDVPYLLKTPGFTNSCAAFSGAIATMTAVPGSGGDSPEAYNRAFYEAYADGGNPIVLTRDPLASQFLVVLGDAEPHSATAFGACPAAPPADFGRNGIAGGGDDLNTSATIAGLNAANIDLLMIRYIDPFTSVSLACYQSMANATGGTAVDQSGAPSIGQFIINNAAAVPYTVNLQVTPATCPIGLSFSPAPPYGPFTGPSTTNFTETITAPTVVGTYNCTVTAVMTPGGPTTATEDITVVVTPGTPARLVLTPVDDTNTVGDPHVVTATVTDVFGNPVSGVTVRFTVQLAATTAATPSSGSATTNASGQATFTFTAALPGDNPITAFADTNNDGSQNIGEPDGAANKKWVLPVGTALCEIKVTDGGHITATNGDPASFGGVARSDDSGNASGNEEYQDHGPAMPMNVKATEILAITCTPDFKTATVYGTATIDGSGSYAFRIRMTDNNEPGKGFDVYGILLSNGYNSGDEVLDGGNIQIHKL